MRKTSRFLLTSSLLSLLGMVQLNCGGSSDVNTPAPIGGAAGATVGGAMPVGATTGNGGTSSTAGSNGNSGATNTGCVDLASDPLHCGDCATVCAANEVCDAGQCELACGEGLEACSAACVDRNSDQRQCGECGMACGEGEL